MENWNLLNETGLVLKSTRKPKNIPCLCAGGGQSPLRREWGPGLRNLDSGAGFRLRGLGFRALGHGSGNIYPKCY